MEYGLIGEKLGHSFSKIIHEKAGKYKYELKEIPKDELDSFLSAKNFKGINVTIPYKQSVIPYLDYVDENAKKIGAVNTIVNKSGKLYGYNTDFGGMKMLIERSKFDYKNKKVLILGSGGTSKTAFAVAKSLGAKEIIRVSRNGEVNYNNVKELHKDCDYIINTTPCGMYPNNYSSAIDFDGFLKLKGVTDVVYNPLRTELSLKAKKQGISSECGLFMLVAQAVLAMEKFTDSTCDSNITEEIFSELISEKENIVLTGMPGSGKSTVGKAISKIMGRDFFDTDELVAKNADMSIPEIFSKYGEKYFRDAETEAVKEISKRNGIIIATGGGAVLREENVDALRQNGKIYFLDRPIENIKPTSDRPLARDFEAIKKRFEERYETYLKTSDKAINVDGIVSNTVEKILENFYENTHH